MKKIILHIGQPKTGSSSIQNLFHWNLEYFDRQRVGYYICAQTYNPWPGGSNGDFLGYSALERLGVDQIWSGLTVIHEMSDALAKERQRFRKYVSEHDIVVLSEEALWDMGVMHEGFWEKVKEVLEEMCDEEIGICVVLYLRRQDDWVFSKWKENVRGAEADILDFHDTVKNYDEIGHLDYALQVNRIAAVFGRDNLILRSYDRSSFVNGDINTDFLAVTGIPYQKDQLRWPPKSVNPSLTIDVTEAIRQLNLLRMKRGLPAVKVYYHALTLSKKHPDPKGIYPLSPDEHRKLLDKYSAVNRELSVLFNDGLPFFKDDLRQTATWTRSPIRIGYYALKLRILQPIIGLYHHIRESRTYCDLARRRKKIFGR